MFDIENNLFHSVSVSLITNHALPSHWVKCFLHLHACYLCYLRFQVLCMLCHIYGLIVSRQSILNIPTNRYFLRSWIQGHYQNYIFHLYKAANTNREKLIGFLPRRMMLINVNYACNHRDGVTTWIQLINTEHMSICR
jgi:hypothetical protein